jgi:iron(III) transport system substrate-binding protein
MENSTPPARSLRRRRLLRTAAASLLMLGTSRAIAVETRLSNDLIAAARKEGTLAVYTSSDMEMTIRWSGVFTRTYDISVKVVRGPGYPIFDRWQNEGRVGRHIMDVMQLSDPTLLDEAFKQGFITNYAPAAEAAIYPEKERSGVWYALRASTMGMGYNSKLANATDEGFLHTAGWNAWTDPRWKGRCATTAGGSGGSTYANTFMFMKNAEGPVRRAVQGEMGGHKPEIYIGKPPLFNRLSAGQYAIGDEATSTDINLQYLKGAPVRWVHPEPTPARLSPKTNCQ